MKLKVDTARDLKSNILEKIGHFVNLNEYEIFLFGSRVSSTAGDDRSDIDIGIEGDEPIPLEIMAKIKIELDDIPTLYKIDLVDFKMVSNDFYEIAKEKIELLN